MRNQTVDTHISEQFAPEVARDLTDKIRAGLEGVFELIKAAYSGFAWAALGYSSWDEYVQREFGNLYLRPPREEREDIISSMRDVGMSIRAIATATNLAVGTVHKEASKSGVQNRTPDHADLEDASPSEGLDSTQILGQDGRLYSASRPDTFPESDTSREEPTKMPEQHPGHRAFTDVNLDAVLDAPAEDVGVTPLDASEIQSERDSRISKLLEAFHGNDLGSLPRTMKLAEQISGLVSPLSGHVSVDSDAYESLAANFSSAVRQFSFVIKRLSQARAEFVSDDVIGLVVDDLRAALNFLRDSVQEMKNK